MSIVPRVPTHSHDDGPAEWTAVMPVAALLGDIRHRLQTAGIDTSEHDARLLVADSLAVEGSDLRMAEILDLTVTQMLERAQADSPRTVGDVRNDLTVLAARVSRRIRREPLQYIVGHTCFRYIDVQVGDGVFIPRPETETVVQAGIDMLQDAGVTAPRIVDLCAGSGIIGLSLGKEIPGSRIWAVEMSHEASVWTLKNRDALVASGDISPERYRLTLADATDADTLAELNGTIDLVISNPPYIPESDVPQQPEVADWDPDVALYGGSRDGLRIPIEIIRRAFSFLHPGGALVMEHDISQAEALCASALETGFTHARTGADLTGRPRFLIATL